MLSALLPSLPLQLKKRALDQLRLVKSKPQKSPGQPPQQLWLDPCSGELLPPHLPRHPWGPCHIFTFLAFSSPFPPSRPGQEPEALQPGAPCGGADPAPRGAVTQLHRPAPHQEPAGPAHLPPGLPRVPSR